MDGTTHIDAIPVGGPAIETPKWQFIGGIEIQIKDRELKGECEYL